jgi:hypothetical protein
MKKLYLLITFSFTFLCGDVYSQENTYTRSEKDRADSVRYSDESADEEERKRVIRSEYLLERDNEQLQLLREEARKANDEAREAKRIERRESAEAKEARRALKAEEKAQKARKKADRLSRQAMKD